MKFTGFKAVLPSRRSTRVATMIVLHWCVVIAMAFALSAKAAKAANELVLSNKPLFVQNSAPSNVFFMVDDSGSMDWSVMSNPHWHFTNYTQALGAVGLLEGGVQVVFTDAVGDSCRDVGITGAGPSGSSVRYIYDNADNVYGGCGSATVEENHGFIPRDWRILNSDVNVLYYDPSQTYDPWPGYDNASFGSVRSHPNESLPGYAHIRDLSEDGGFVFMVAEDVAGYSGTRPAANNRTAGANGQIDLWDTYLRVKVTNSAIEIHRITHNGPYSVCSATAHLEDPPYKSCLGATKTSVPFDPALLGGRTTLAQEKQNIANWYQYHRRRSFVPRAAIAEVIRSVPNFRYGISMINNYGDLFVPFPELDDNFTMHNQALLESLYAYPQQGRGTPLRTGLERVGRYYEGKLSDYDNPYLSQCQQSFSLLMSDGYWNGSNPANAIGDSDGDGINRTLADVAHHYYNRDLSPLDDEVPVDSSCDASAPGAVCDLKSTQHMVTFTLAFGVQGKKVDTNADGWPDPFLTEAGNWGNPFSGSAFKIDDMWHAAYNSRGRFISARTPAEVREGLIDAINTIASRNNSGSAVAVNRATLTTDSLVFRTSFTSTDWSGEVTALAVDLETGIPGGEVWSAATELEKIKPTDRTVLTYQPASKKGVAFRWPDDHTSPKPEEISASQVAALLKDRESQPAKDYGQALVNYLRGDDSAESLSAGADPSAIAFRLRKQVLGDVIDSEPVYVGKPNRRYDDEWGSGAPENDSPYSEFKKIERQPMLYVGANDGMLHGFATSGDQAGKELLAYVPNGIFNRLSNLAQSSYTHEYFVNGSPIAEDVFFSKQPVAADNGWRTILVGSLGVGGQSIFALDVTQPSAFSESNADKTVLWEFTDPDLGLTVGQPAVGRMENGRWVVVFGSGINNTREDGSASASGNAFLYIVDAETGELIKKFDTQQGFAEDPTGLERPNGIWSPALVDSDDDGMIESIVAGDLYGNLWKWVVDSSSVSSWSFALSGSKPQPLFIAKNASGESQPITTKPEVGFHPSEPDSLIVFFGTGKYIEVNDNVSELGVTQTFYAVSDNTSTSFNRSKLQRQRIVSEYTGTGLFDLRKTSDNKVDWDTQKGWYLDLKSPGGATNGERVINDPVLRGGKVIFTTVIPSADACAAGGSGWLMELTANTGARPSEPVVDINGDGVVDALDALPGPAGTLEFSSGLRNRDGGMPEKPAIVLENQRREKKYINQSSGGVMVVTEDSGLPRAGRQSWRQVR